MQAPLQLQTNLNNLFRKFALQSRALIEECLSKELKKVLKTKGLNKQFMEQFHLTEREMQVCELAIVVPYLHRKEIAARLSVSMSTVRFHLSAIYRKCGMKLGGSREALYELFNPHQGSRNA